uniref:Uncharacterized protein n=1 Tax=Plectus sambesii TaxID=2011161 RepID=A0A914V975_9BILA
MNDRGDRTIYEIEFFLLSGASYDRSLQSIEKKLQIAPLPLFVPLFSADGQFDDILDVLRMTRLSFPTDTEKGMEATVVTESSSHFDTLMLRREELFGRLADIDDVFADHLLRAADTNDISLDRDILPAISLWSKESVVSLKHVDWRQAGWQATRDTKQLFISQHMLNSN